MCSDSSSPSQKHPNGNQTSQCTAVSKATPPKQEGQTPPQTTSTDTTQLETTPLPPCLPSIPICLVRQAILQMLCQMGTEKQFLNQHILIYKNIYLCLFINRRYYRKKKKARCHNMAYSTGDGEKKKLLKTGEPFWKYMNPWNCGE